MSTTPTNKETPTMNLHELEEADFGRGPVLWDADPSVCCAAFQLGACSHTEAHVEDEHDAEEVAAAEADFAAVRAGELDPVSAVLRSSSCRFCGRSLLSPVGDDGTVPPDGTTAPAWHGSASCVEGNEPFLRMGGPR